MPDVGHPLQHHKHVNSTTTYFPRVKCLGESDTILANNAIHVLHDYVIRWHSRRLPVPAQAAVTTHATAPLSSVEGGQFVAT